MAVRIPWDQSEAVLLVDAYFMIQNGIIGRKLAVQLISEELRKKAILSKMEINAAFRNTNGINMRFYEIQYIASNGETGMKNTSKLFKETFRQRSDDIEDFQSEYQEALAKIYGSNFSAFRQWLEHGRYVERAKTIEYSLRILDTFGNKDGLMKGSLCDIVDLTIIENLDRTICSNTAIKKYKSQGYDHEKLFASYKDFLNERQNEKESEFVAGTITDKGIREKNFLKSQDANQLLDSYEIKDTDASFDQIEEFVKEADIDGITASNLSEKTGKSIWFVNKYLSVQSYAIEIPGNVYVHADNVIDLFENRAKIQKIIENQFKKFCGYTNDEVLMDAAVISLGMFLNDNCIDTSAKFYGIVRFLFGKDYYFSGGKHVWKSEPKYSMTNSGVLMGFISNNGGRVSKRQCSEYLQKVKLASGNINGLLSMATNKEVLFYGNEEYVLAESIIENENWISLVKKQVDRLFKYSPYVIPREINDNWFELLPPLYGGLNWNLALLQDLIKKYMPEYRLITANENQGLETIRAGIVPEDSVIGNFADLVYARLIEDSTLTMPVRLQKENLRQMLIEYKMIQGNELIYTLPKALDGAKYAWSDDGESVLILR